MQTNREHTKDDRKLWTVTINCDLEDCDEEQEHEMILTEKLFLPDYTRAAAMAFKAKGWVIGKAYPIKRKAVSERDENDQPTAFHMINDSAIGDLCPSCGAKYHRKKDNRR